MCKAIALNDIDAKRILPIHTEVQLGPSKGVAGAECQV